MANTIQIKRGLFASLPVSFLDGEMGWTTDTSQLFIGDGTTKHEVVMKDAYAASSFLYASTAKLPVNKTPSEVMGILSGKAVSNFSMNSKVINSLQTGTLSTDSVNKGYVDNLVQGIKNQSAAIIKADVNVVVATGGLLTLQTIVLTDGDQVLLTNQTTGTENGLWTAHSGAWTRALNWEVGVSAAAFYIFIKEGTYDNAGFICTNNAGSDVIGTATLAFVQFSGAGQVIAGLGLIKNAGNINQIDVNKGDGIQIVGGTTVAVTADVLRDADFIAYSILKADTTGTPIPLSISTNAVVGRIAGAITNIPIDADLTTVSTLDDSIASAKAIKTYIDNKVASDTFIGDTDTPATYSTGKFLRSSTVGIDFVAFDNTLHGTTATNNAPTSNAFYQHDHTNTGVHGAGTNVLLNSGSLIDCGTF